MPLECLVVGTDTGVGKTRVTVDLVGALRRRGRRVWVHKPAASGARETGGLAEDAQTFAALTDPTQPAGSACPIAFAEMAAPAICARLHGIDLDLETLRTRLLSLRGDNDLIIEGVGGPLAPIGSDNCGILDIVGPLRPLTLLVTRPHLGTLNHTRLAIAAIREAGLPLAGLVMNHHEMVETGPATVGLAAYLQELTGLPVLGEWPFAERTEDALSDHLADCLLAMSRKDAP